MQLSVRDELRSHTPHAIGPHTSGMLWAVACLRRDPSRAFRACSRSWSHISMLPKHTRLLFAGMFALLINCVAEKSNAHSSYVISVAFSPDGTKIVSGSNDGKIKVWDSGAPRAQNRPSLPKTDACWIVWQASWSC